MGDSKQVDQHIDKLAAMLPGGFFPGGKPDWKALWNQIRKTGAAFKSANYPTKADHQQAWNRYQEFVAEVKRRQAEDRAQWEQKQAESARLRDRIVAQAESARPPGVFADMVMFLLTGGMSEMVKMALSAILGPFDERKQDLLAANAALKKGWALLHESKDRMLGRDKQQAFEALNAAKANLNREWEDYKRERQKAVDHYHREREAKQRAWRDRAEENVRNLEDRRQRLGEILAKREAHVSELYDKLSDARSDDYRYRVSGWIDEEEANIRGLRDKLQNVEEWLYEAQAKLTR